MPIVPKTSVPKLFSRENRRMLSVKIHNLEKILLTRLILPKHFVKFVVGFKTEANSNCKLAGSLRETYFFPP